ncbi:MAG: hypothetical protein INR64_13035 [Caulobacteraceae bacterium]|nr:hypothetical protein [Caulobacter sp.]
MTLQFLLLNYGVAILLCWHVVRTRQDSFWLWILLAFPVIGWAAYLFIVVLPGVVRGPGARKAAAEARKALDPGREHREATAAVQLTPTVANRMRLAAAAAGLGRWDEAETQYREAAQGIHADDPALRLGRAKALLELGRAAEALTLTHALVTDEETPPSPDAILAHARALEATGRADEAETFFRQAYDRMPGFEAIARYAAFLNAQGRRDQGRLLLADMDDRITRLHGPFAREARAWRELAAQGAR